jgi:hypothetical protein
MNLTKYTNYKKYAPLILLVVFGTPALFAFIGESCRGSRVLAPAQQETASIIKIDQNATEAIKSTGVLAQESIQKTIEVHNDYVRKSQVIQKKKDKKQKELSESVNKNPDILGLEAEKVLGIKYEK